MTTNRGAILEAKELTKVFAKGEIRVHALRGVNLRLEEGRFVAIMGPSGSGKSTLLHILGALDSQSSGDVVFEGETMARWGLEPRSSHFRLRNIGFIFQAYNLIQHLTIVENVALPLLLAGRHLKDARTRAETTLSKVGLGERLSHYPNELSGGEQQRVAIARALVHKPRIVLADEPTGNLDSRAAARILDLLTTLHTEERTTIVLITHDPFVAAYAEQVIFLRDGQVIDQWERPTHLGLTAAGAAVAERMQTVLGGAIR